MANSWKRARPERFELPTYWFEASRSIQLSYGRAICSLAAAQKPVECTLILPRGEREETEFSSALAGGVFFRQRGPNPQRAFLAALGSRRRLEEFFHAGGGGARPRPAAVRRARSGHRRKSLAR